MVADDNSGDVGGDWKLSSSDGNREPRKSLFGDFTYWSDIGVIAAERCA